MPLLSVRDLIVRYESSHGRLSAVSGVSFDIEPGETVGLVGESGCGKSSLAKAIMQLAPVSEGSIAFEGRDCGSITRHERAEFRRKIQMIFQDPYGSLNPRHDVLTIIRQPLLVAGWRRAEANERTHDLMDQVGLPRQAATRYPHEFSGGQRQRIGIARALALEPQLVVCDEPVSALDVSVRAQIINLLTRLQRGREIAFLFISHDLSVIEHVAKRVLVMYLGRIVEAGPVATVWRSAAHPYTRALLASAPIADPRVARRRIRKPIEGELPSPYNPPSGCVFVTRCPFAQDRCRHQQPQLRPAAEGHSVACHFDLPPLVHPVPEPIVASSVARPLHTALKG